MGVGCSDSPPRVWAPGSPTFLGCRLALSPVDAIALPQVGFKTNLFPFPLASFSRTPLLVCSAPHPLKDTGILGLPAWSPGGLILCIQDDPTLPCPLSWILRRKYWGLGKGFGDTSRSCGSLLPAGCPSSPWTLPVSRGPCLMCGGCQLCVRIADPREELQILVL